MIEADVAQKQCPECGEWKPDTHEFFERQHKPNGKVYPRSECRKCHVGRDTARRKAKRQSGLNGHSHPTAIKPVGTWEQCGCCGTTKGNIIGDMDEATHEKYGYLCMKCYRLVRDFGGDLNRMHKAIDYVEKTRVTCVAHKKMPTMAKT